ncbi:MAG: cytochrome P450 [Gammaproteobacteria bacterium]|nr:cytochrome P450 [Gammaproteobacteria bacterium]
MTETFDTTRQPPQVKGFPILGNILDLAKDPGKFFYHCYRQYGPVFSIKVLNKSYKVLAGPEAAKFMGSGDGKIKLRSREFWEGLINEYQTKYLLGAEDGEIHKKLRNVMKNGFSKKALDGKYDQFIETTDNMLEKDWLPGNSVPVVAGMQRLVTAQLGWLLTGRVPLDYVEDIRITIQNILNVLVTRQRPKILLKMPAYKKAFKRVTELGNLMVEDYYANKGKKSQSEKTLVDAIMEEHERNSDLIPKSDLVLLMTGPYVAGLDTVANTVASMIYLVLKHPKVYQQIQNEVDGIFSKSGPFEESSLKQMPTLFGAIMESMRLYPVAAASMRVANTNFEYENCHIQEGELLYMGITVPHHMEEFFPQPTKFDVHRYSRERAEHMQPGAYSPFGRGPHTCLGKTLADTQMMLSMARLFYRLDLQLDPINYEIKVKTAPTPGPARSFKVRVNGYRN